MSHAPGENSGNPTGNRVPMAVLGACLLTSLALAQQSRPVPGNSPASRPTPTSKPAAPPKYQEATTRQAEANLKRVKDWVAQIKAFAPSTHLVEAPHFWIYSAWDAGNDKPLVEVCEKMYAAMCGQFDIPENQNIWVGKCAILVFSQKEHYRKFATDIHKGGFADAAGYCGFDSDGFVFIAMGPAPNKTAFYGLLVHEATHGFLSRYLSNRWLPIWVNEGLAEFMSATLVPGAGSAGNCVRATRAAIREKKPVADVLDRVGPDSFDYGIAQSFVRFLIARDKAAFIKFVTLLKQGKTEAEAMKAAFNLTREEFIRDWTKAVAASMN